MSAVYAISCRQILHGDWKKRIFVPTKRDAITGRLMQTYTLYELNTHVRALIEDGASGTYWVHGELMEGREGYGGHFYGEMVEKSEATGNIVARARIIIWARTYNMIALRFRRETGQSLRPGIRVLMQVRVTFSELYGYSLNVQDVDGAYTLGDMARRRQEILHSLEKDGIIDDNRTLPLPTLLRRIAVVSSATAAGYGDFSRQLLDNGHGLAFRLRLFPAVMQGTQVPESIVSALTAIADEAGEWDAVVIIRGGGATSDLSDYDSYHLAACIAQHPLPVFTGIGHDRDEMVPDRVAHIAFKTPTAVAAFIVEHQLDLLAGLQDLQQRIPQSASQALQRGHQRMALLQQRIPSMAALLMERQQQRLAGLGMRIPMSTATILERQRHRLDMLEQHLRGMDPELLLSRGYTITMVDGRILTDISAVHEGQLVTTRMRGGEIVSTIQEVRSLPTPDAQLPPGIPGDAV